MADLQSARAFRKLALSRPFRWTATADSILQKIARAFSRISETQHEVCTSPPHAALIPSSYESESRKVSLRSDSDHTLTIHQPLHAVKEAKGGNEIHVRFLGDDRCGFYDCNLHGVWDTDMILHTGLNRQDYAQHLEDLISHEHLAIADAGTPEQWSNESLQLAGAAWVPDETNLDEQYYQREIKVVDRQMALAGLRLAKLLNNTIGKMTPREFR